MGKVSLWVKRSAQALYCLRLAKLRYKSIEGSEMSQMLHTDPVVSKLVMGGQPQNRQKTGVRTFQQVIRYSVQALHMDSSNRCERV